MTQESRRNGRTRDKPLTMKALAEYLGVHPSTVSRALDPTRSHLVSDETRDEIRRTAEAMSYRLDPSAANLRRGRTRTIGLLVPDLANPTIIQTVRAFTKILDRHDQLPLIAESMDDPERSKHIIERFLTRRSDAIVSLAATEDDRNALASAAAEVPVVLAVRPLAGSTLPTVRCDDFKGASIAAQHLAQLGHTRVAQVRGPTMSGVFVDRAKGFETTAAACGISVVNLRPAVHATENEGYAIVSEAFADDAIPATAIFCHNDSLAIGARAALTELGLPCPEAVSLVGFNANVARETSAQELTSLIYPSNEIGRCAGEMVLSLLDEQPEPSAPVVFPPELKLGQSTGPSNETELSSGIIR